MVVQIQNGSVLLRDQAVATTSGCCCGQCPPGKTKCASNCCTQEQTCCSGSCCDNVCCEGVCCQPGEACVGGECVGPCVCPDFCIYQAQLLSPFQGSAYPQQPCFYDNNFFRPSNRAPNFMPCPPVPSGIDVVVRSEEYAEHGFGSVGFVNDYKSTFVGYREYLNNLQFPGNFQVRTSAEVRVSLSCNLTSEQKPAFVVAVTLDVRAYARKLERDRVGIIRVFAEGEIVHTKTATYLLDADECEKYINRSCYPSPESSNQRVSYATMPLNVEVDLDGTSLGPWQDVDVGVSDDFGLAGGCFNAQAAFSLPVTFRITQLQSCFGSNFP